MLKSIDEAAHSSLYMTFSYQSSLHGYINILLLLLVSCLKAIMDFEGAASTLLHLLPSFPFTSVLGLSCHVGDWREAHGNSREKE